MIQELKTSRILKKLSTTLCRWSTLNHKWKENYRNLIYLTNLIKNSAFLIAVALIAFRSKAMARLFRLEREGKALARKRGCEEDWM